MTRQSFLTTPAPTADKSVPDASPTSHRLGQCAGVSGKCSRCASHSRQEETPRTASSSAGDVPPVMHEALPGSHGQPQLWVAQADSPAEQEADRIAAQIMQSSHAMPSRPSPVSTVSPPLHRQTIPTKQLSQNRNALPPAELAVAPAVGTQIQHLQNQGGEGLPASTRAFMEPRFGHRFSAVRVHRTPQAHQLAQALNAQAFTVGHDIVVGRENSNLDSPQSRRLLAHELAHTLQYAHGPSTFIHRAPAAPAPPSAPAPSTGAPSTGAPSTAPPSTVNPFTSSTGSTTGCAGNCDTRQSTVEAARQKALERIDTVLGTLGQLTPGVTPRLIDRDARRTQRAFEQYFGAPDAGIRVPGARSPGLVATPSTTITFKADVETTLQQVRTAIANYQYTLAGATPTPSSTRTPVSSPVIMCASPDCNLDDRCDDEIANYHRGVITFCSTFFRKSFLQQQSTVIHETVHGIIGNGPDVYTPKRLFNLLTRLEDPRGIVGGLALQNPDSFASFVLYASGVGKGDAKTKGPAPLDAFSNFGGDPIKQQEAERALAFAELWLEQGQDSLQALVATLDKFMGPSPEFTLWVYAPRSDRDTMARLRGVDPSSPCANPTGPGFELNCPRITTSPQPEDQVIPRRILTVIRAMRGPLKSGLGLRIRQNRRDRQEARAVVFDQRSDIIRDRIRVFIPFFRGDRDQQIREMLEAIRAEMAPNSYPSVASSSPRTSPYTEFLERNFEL